MSNYNKYQSDYSDLHPDVHYNVKSRVMKGKKILAVLQNYLGSNLDGMNLCDVGCSTRIQTRILSGYFKISVGVDIDTSAIQYANKYLANEKLKFVKGDSMDLPFSDNFLVLLYVRTYMSMFQMLIGLWMKYIESLSRMAFVILQQATVFNL